MPAEYTPILDENGERKGTIISPDVDPASRLIVEDANGKSVKAPILYKVHKPVLADGTEWNQVYDAARHIRHSLSLGLPQLQRRVRPRYGRAVIVGGAPSIKDHLEHIRALAADKNNAVFALNWSHNWLIQNGIVPRGCVFFEIDVEPDTVIKTLHPDVTYFICSHCHEKTFEALKNYKCVLWHSPPNSKPEEEVHKELDDKIVGDLVGGGVSTFTRTITIALFLGYRHFDVFGCDSSFPADKGSHVEGYETIMDPNKDLLEVWAQSPRTGEVRYYKTYGYLAMQQEEFKTYCNNNHIFFSMQVHGDSLLRFTHEDMFPEQYDPDTYTG